MIFSDLAADFFPDSHGACTAARHAVGGRRFVFSAGRNQPAWRWPGQFRNGGRARLILS